MRIGRRLVLAGGPPNASRRPVVELRLLKWATPALSSHANAEVLARITVDLQGMTPDDLVVSLGQAGIFTPAGKLTEHYANQGEAVGAKE